MKMYVTRRSVEEEDNKLWPLAANKSQKKKKITSVAKEPASGFRARSGGCAEADS